MKKKLEFTDGLPEHKILKSTRSQDGSLHLDQQDSSGIYTISKPVNKVASLHKAARDGFLEKVKSLVEGGVDIEAKTTWGASALYLAITNKHLEIASFLIEKGADVNAKTKLHDNSLNAAMGFLDLRFAKLLLENGASVEAKTLSGDSPLHVAAKYSNLQLARLLLAYGANTESESHEGLTSLSIAIKSMNSGVAKALVLYGANITNHDIYEAIVAHATYDERSLVDIFRAATTLDLLFKQEGELQYVDNAESLPNLFNNLSSSVKDLLFNRVLYKSFRNKPLSVDDVKEITDNLITKLEFITKTLGVDLHELESVLNQLDECIIVSSMENEVAAPSLFKLATNSLKENDLWDQEEMEETHPDIADKVKAMEVIESFLNKVRITLKPKDSNSSESNIEVESTAGNGSDESVQPLVGENYYLIENDHALIP